MQLHALACSNVGTLESLISRALAQVRRTAAQGLRVLKHGESADTTLHGESVILWSASTTLCGVSVCICFQVARMPLTCLISVQSPFFASANTTSRSKCQAMNWTRVPSP